MADEEELEFLSLIGLMLSVILRTRRRIKDLDDEAQWLIKESRKRCEALRRASRRRYRRRRAAVVRRMLQETAVRRIWKHSRPSGEVFWSNALKNFGDEEWYQHFRMSRRTFNYLLSLVKPALTRKTTNWRRPYDPSLRLAVAIWWYATPSDYRTISCLFGVGMSTVCVFLREVTRALKDSLLERFISLPKLDQLQLTLDAFAARGYPMCGGAIDEIHIPITAPRDDPASYHNRKGGNSIVLQAVVDHRFCFTDVYVGWPGRTHDARVLSNSTIFIKAEQQDGYLFPREMSRDINGVEVPVHLIGDAAYPLKKWLMKGFTHHRLTPEQSTFNYRLSSARMVVENAFGRLKGRWKCLAKRCDVDIHIMRDIVIACCILHNVCEINKDNYLADWNTDATDLPEPNAEAVCAPPAGGAQQIREAIMSVL